MSILDLLRFSCLNTGEETRENLSEEFPETITHKNMSYDLQVTKGKEELQNFLLQKGGEKKESGEIYFKNPLPYLAFWLSGDAITFPYLLNHYHVNFVYDVLKMALTESPILEFTDAQLGRTFNQQNKDQITKEYVMECAINYAVVNTNMLKVNQGEGKETISMATMGKPVPIEYDIIQAMSEDLYNLAEYKESAKSKEVYFPKPFSYVNLENPAYKIVYVWTEFIDQVFPPKLPIDYLRFTWLNKDQTDVAKVLYYDYKTFMALLPTPEEIDDPVIGKRLVYKNVLTKDPEIYKKMESLPSLPDLPQEFQADSELGSFASTVVLPDLK